MKNNMKKYIFICIWLISSSTVFAQLSEEIWSSAEIEHEISKDLEFSFGQEYRFETKFKRNRTVYNDFGLNYQFDNGITVGSGYRIRSKKDDLRHELMINLGYEYEIYNFEIDYRFKYHLKYETDDSKKHYLRNKISLAYNFSKKFQVALSAESYYNGFSDNGNKFDKSRLESEISYDITKKIKISGFYIFENEFRVPEAKDADIYGINIKFSID